MSAKNIWRHKSIEFSATPALSCSPLAAVLSQWAAPGWATWLLDYNSSQRRSTEVIVMFTSHCVVNVIVWHKLCGLWIFTATIGITLRMEACTHSGTNAVDQKSEKYTKICYFSWNFSDNNDHTHRLACCYEHAFWRIECWDRYEQSCACFTGQSHHRTL